MQYVVMVLKARVVDLYWSAAIDTNQQSRAQSMDNTHAAQTPKIVDTIHYVLYKWLFKELEMEISVFMTSFLYDKVTSENHWQIASWVTQKSLFTVTNVLFYFLHVIQCPEQTIPLKQWQIAHFAIVAKDGLFWFGTVMSQQLICDVTWAWGTGIVTSYSSIVLARANWCKGNLH